MKIVNHFRKSYQNRTYLTQKLKENLIIGGGLQGYSKTQKELYKTFNESLNFTEFSDEIHEQKEEFDFIDDNNEDIAEENETEIPNKNNKIIIENYFDFNSQEFQKALNMNIRVIIEETEYIDHENKNFNINAILDTNLN
ncbi:16666_t:CDS:2 [Funneliformis geosporum]|uniref:16666_t:CDS:1 n=1 Tax=Funneliformis geosporum TaxID=1117311 RepID=A0A9W4SQZ8_9GLOM|nr:16666_t:CDS:2 [Funneliformis geosporum]